jgi:hypothetical protein
MKLQMGGESQAQHYNNVFKVKYIKTRCKHSNGVVITYF